MKNVKTFNVFGRQYQRKMLKLPKILVLTFVASYFKHFFAFLTFFVSQSIIYWEHEARCGNFLSMGEILFSLPSAMGQVLFYPLKSRYLHAHIHTSRSHTCIHAFKTTPDNHIRRHQILVYKTVFQ